jgi:hypothetical protein
MPLFAAKGMSATGGGGSFYTLLEAKRDTADNSSYRQPTGMFDVSASSSGEVYTLNGERNVLTGLYNAIVAKVGSIGAVSWQYTISAANNVYPCGITCNTDDNSVFVVLMKTTNTSGADNYTNKTNDVVDRTNNPIYHFIKFSSSGTRLWENIWSSSNAATYPGGIGSTLYNTTQVVQSNVFDNRNTGTQSNIGMHRCGAPDLKINRSADNTIRTSNSHYHHPIEFSKASISHTLFGTAYGDPDIYSVYGIDGPRFGGRPQSTSNIAIDVPNESFYILIAGNATATALSQSRNTMQMVKIPFNGANVSSREIVYPGAWDQNAKISLDVNNKLLIPWTSTNTEVLKNSTIGGTSDWDKTISGTTSNVDTANQGTYLRIDWATDNDYELTTYSSTDVAPCKVCKVESEPIAEGTAYEYVSTGGLTPTPGASLGGRSMSRSNSSTAADIGRYTNFVQLHKKNVGTNALDWVRTFFATAPGEIRDGNQCSADDVSLATPEISFSDSKVFANGVYYLGNVVMPSSGLRRQSDINLATFGFIAKINFDGSIDYIREIRALISDIDNHDDVEYPHYYYQTDKNGGVLLDSINFDAFNNMIVTARHISDSKSGSFGNYIDNVIFKLPHNGDLIGPIQVVTDSINDITERFTYLPASIVKCWEECTIDTSITYSGSNETYRALRSTAMWAHDGSGTDPTAVAAPTSYPTYNATFSVTRIATLDNGTYASRWLWQAPTTNLQLDPTETRQWDRADRRSSSSIFLQTVEETDALSQITAVASCPGYVYVDQTVNTDNAQTDFDAAVYTKLKAYYEGKEDSRILKQEMPNALVTVSQYWDGSTGYRTQLLSRHSPTGGVETRAYDCGVNTYPQDICIDEIGNIYVVGWFFDGNKDQGYITVYDKDMNLVTDRFLLQSNSGITNYDDENIQIHCCAVTMDSANTATLILGGKYKTNSGNDQHGVLFAVPVAVSQGGASFLPGSTSITFEGGAIRPNQSIDIINGVDIIQTGPGNSSNMIVGYAGSLYDTTGSTTRGQYGLLTYSGSSFTIMDGYIIGDDLELEQFAFRKSIAGYERTQTNDYSITWAVGGKETQAGDTNAAILVGRSTYNATALQHTQTQAPANVTSFVMNNGNGADYIKGLRWGYTAVPLVDETLNNKVVAVGNGIASGMYESQEHYRNAAYEDKLYASVAVTNQFTQLDTYLVEITPSLNGGNITGTRPDSSMITNVAKLNTSGITEPASICVLGPQYGTMMASAVCANSGAPNDRQLLTVKLPMDFSKKASTYTQVGSMYVYWDDADFSFGMSGRSIFNAEFRQQSQASYNDGTRFVQTNGNGAQLNMTTVGTTGAASAINDISTLGTFAIRTQDLQQYKQS